MTYDQYNSDPAKLGQRITKGENRDSNWAIGGTIALVVFLYIFFAVGSCGNIYSTASSNDPPTVGVQVTPPPASEKL